VLAANDIPLLDGYDPSTTYIDPAGVKVDLQVWNNSAVFQLYKLYGEDPVPVAEDATGPGSMSFTGAIGVRAKNKVAGQVARVFVRIPNRTDPQAVGFTPITAILTAGGVKVPGQEIAYQEFTSAVTLAGTTEATATQLVNASSITADGSTPIYVEFEAPYVDQVGTQRALFALYQDGASIGLLSNELPAGGGAGGVTHVRLARRFLPLSGAHVYGIRGFSTLGTSVVGAGVGGSGNYMPGFIRITTVIQ
jgi:hypothetical protein